MATPLLSVAISLFSTKSPEITKKVSASNYSFNEWPAIHLGMRFRAIFAALLALTALPSPAVAKQLISPKAPAFIYAVNEEYFVNSHSYLIALRDGGQIECDSATDSKCNRVKSLASVSQLPPCSENVSKFCIAYLELREDSGATSRATLVRSLEGKKIPAAENLDLAYGATMSLWKVVRKDGTTQNYLASIYQQFQSFPDGADCSTASLPAACKMSLGGFSATIVPVTAATSDCISLGAKGPSDCFVRNEFLPGEKMAVSVHVNSRLSGFLSGRITDSAISVTPIDSETNDLVISGMAQDIPAAQFTFLKSEVAANPELQKKIATAFGNRTGPGDQTTIAGSPPGVESKSYLALGDGAVVWDTTKSLWRVKSFTGPATSKCLDDKTKLLGYVSTNSAEYQSAPPNFDRATGSLLYQVASPHFAENGEVYRGRYELILRSEVARCLYGFTSAPVKAEISISDSYKVATTSQGEKDGWLRLSAYNFEFSNPVISVKLSQSTTITCVKGKLTKKVSAVNPKCPAGYRKK